MDFSKHTILGRGLYILCLHGFARWRAGKPFCGRFLGMLCTCWQCGFSVLLTPGAAIFVKYCFFIH